MVNRINRNKEKTQMSETLTVNLVSGTDGSFDRAASQAAFNQAFDKMIADRQTQQDTIQSAVKEYLDEQGGKPVAMPTVASQVATLKLNSQPENHRKLSDAVLGYIRANLPAKGDESETSLLVSTRGPHGGISFRTAKK